MKKLLLLLLSVLLIPVLSLAQEEEIEKQGWLGVYSKNLSKPVRIALNVDDGVIVTDVVKNSPAEKSGVEIGDIILKIAGKDIDNQKDLVKLVRSHPNQKVEIELQRKGKIKKISLALGEREEPEFYEFQVKKPKKAWKNLKKFFKELEPFWEKGSAKYKEEMARLKEEIKELRRELNRLKRELEEKIKEKGK
ncbi:MAG: PDZ domain-containing protein [bacterium]|nr:PDZ domain-containing protein [candidate division WOR-3 bacterium]MDH5683010.1 PDZ domain-containing protein [candidate division WOR-3 bacterium]